LVGLFGLVGVLLILFTRIGTTILVGLEIVLLVIYFVSPNEARSKR